MALHEWASFNLAKKLGSKFQNDWRSIPFEERRAWAKLMVAGVIMATAALYGAIAVLHMVTGSLNHLPWEEAGLRIIEATPVGFATAIWLQTFGADFMLVFVVLTAAGLAIWHDRPLFAVTLVLSLITMDAVVRIGWFSLSRDRPDIIARGVAAPAFHSFPSGHTAKTVAVYGVLVAQWFRSSRSIAERILIVAIGVLITSVVPYGRLRMGVHWPTDVLAGWFIGGVWLCFAIAALRHERGLRRG